MRKTMIIFVMLAILLAGFFITIEYTYKNGMTADEKPPETADVAFDLDDNVKQVSAKDMRRIDEQKQTDKKLQNTYKKGSYTMENPFIVKDPYDATPLTALAMFSTDDPAQITVTVKGKDRHTDIQHTYEKFTTEHQIPIVGLYPGQKNTIILEATAQDGETVKQRLTIKTASLPDDFLTNEVIKSQPEKMENGLTFVVPSSRYVYALDANGDVRWYSSLWNSHVFERLENGNLLYIAKEKGQNQYNEILEMDMLGKVYNSYLVQLKGYPDTNVVHHDAIELPNGNLLATVHDMDAPYIEDEMIEIDRETGETVQDFSFRSIFPKDMYENYGGFLEEDGDWFHQNAIWYDQDDEAILVSSRHQDLVMKMDYPSGEINWILAADEKWPADYKGYLLDGKGEDFKFPGGPHAIMTMPDMDNNPATNDYLLFDNNIVITRGDDRLSEDFSRMVQYRVNPDKMTAEEIWSFGEERGEALFSSIVGDANYLPETGNRMLTSGYIDAENGMNSRIIEVTGDKQTDVVYEAVISGFKAESHRQAYRAFRLPIYPKKTWNFSLH